MGPTIPRVGGNRKGQAKRGREDTYQDHTLPSPLQWEISCECFRDVLEEPILGGCRSFVGMTVAAGEPLRPTLGERSPGGAELDVAVADGARFFFLLMAWQTQCKRIDLTDGLGRSE